MLKIQIKIRRIELNDAVQRMTKPAGRYGVQIMVLNTFCRFTEYILIIDISFHISQKL